MSFLPWTTFARIADRYSGDRRVRNLPCTEHFRALAFAQLTLRESLRDIETCLAAHPSKLYHSGFSAPVRRATLARANQRRDWRIQADFASASSPTPSTVQPRETGSHPVGQPPSRAVVQAEPALSQRLGQRDQSSSLNGCLNLCAPFGPSQGPYNPVPFYTNLQILRDLPAVQVQ